MFKRRDVCLLSSVIQSDGTLLVVETPSQEEEKKNQFKEVDGDVSFQNSVSPLPPTRFRERICRPPVGGPSLRRSRLLPFASAEDLDASYRRPDPRRQPRNDLNSIKKNCIQALTAEATTAPTTHLHLVAFSASLCFTSLLWQRLCPA